MNKYKYNGVNVTEKTFWFHPTDVYGQVKRGFTLTTQRGKKIEVYGSYVQDVAYIVVNGRTKYQFTGKHATLAAHNFASLCIR